MNGAAAGPVQARVHERREPTGGERMPRRAEPATRMPLSALGNQLASSLLSGAAAGMPRSRSEDQANAIASTVSAGDAVAGLAAGRYRSSPPSPFGADHGRSLSAAERVWFEPRFGQSLADVRVREGDAADALTRAIGANAVAFGPEIAFRRGAMAGQKGRDRMAHELAHVAQWHAGARAQMRADIFDASLTRQLVRADFEGLDVDTVTRLVSAMAAYIGNFPEGSTERLALQENLDLATAVLAEMTTEYADSPPSAPETPQPRGRSRSAPEGETPEPFSGAYAASIGLSLEFVDTQTFWSSEEERREFHESYLGYAREHGDEAQRASAAAYVFRLSERRARRARERAEEQSRARAEAQYRRDLEILQNNRPGLLHILLPAHSRHTFRDRSHLIRDPYLRSVSRANVEAVFGAARLGRDVTAAALGISAALGILAGVGLVAVEGGAVAALVAGGARAIAFAGGELTLAAGALRAAGQAAWVFYLGNAIAVNEIGIFTVGTVIAVEGDVAGLLEAMASDPLAAAQILFEVWVLKVNISVANGPPRRYSVRARALPARSQTNPRALRLQVVSEPELDTAPAPRAATPTRAGEEPPATPARPASPLREEGSGGDIDRIIRDLEGPGEPGPFRAEGPPVRVRVSGADDPVHAHPPARVLEVGAGQHRTDLGIPPERRLVAVTRTDVRGRAPAAVSTRQVRHLDATQPIPRQLEGQFDTVIINNPRGYNVDIANIGRALRPGGRIIVQGRGRISSVGRRRQQWNPNFQQLLDADPPPGYRKIVDLEPTRRREDPTNVLGGPFRRTSGEEIPTDRVNGRIIYERTEE